MTPKTFPIALFPYYNERFAKGCVREISCGIGGASMLMNQQLVCDTVERNCHQMGVFGILISKLNQFRFYHKLHIEITGWMTGHDTVN